MDLYSSTSPSDLPPAPVPVAPKKNRTGLWVALGAGCLVLCCVGFLAVGGIALISKTLIGPTAPDVVIVTEEARVPIATDGERVVIVTATTNEEVVPVPVTPIPVDDACMGAQVGDTLEIMYVYGGGYEAQFRGVLQPLIDQCGLNLVLNVPLDNEEFETMMAAGYQPQAAILSANNIYPYRDRLVTLNDFSIDTANYQPGWVEYMQAGGEWYGLPLMASSRSLIWYNPQQFDNYNYSVPTNYFELQSLVELMADDGNTPWSMGTESGTATGWVGSDFIQNLLLVKEGPDYVQGLMDGSIPYNDPGVAEAYRLYKEWAADDRYAVDGAAGTTGTNFVDAVNFVFWDEPTAMMIMQGGWASVLIPDLDMKEFGTHYDFFEFPGGQGHLVGVDTLVAFDDSPATRALFHYLSTAEGGQNWVLSGMGVSPNQAGLGLYVDLVDAKEADMIVNSPANLADIGDTLGEPFTTAEWQAIINYLNGADLETLLDGLADTQQESISNR